MAEQPSGVAERYEVAVLLGQIVKEGVEVALRVGPGAIGVREVDLDGDVIDPDAIAGRQGAGIAEDGVVEVAAQDLGR